MSGDTPLHLAVSRNDLEIIEKLSAEGADVNALNYYGDTPLHIAVETGKKDAVRILLLKGADDKSKNRYGLTPIQIALTKYKNHKGFMEECTNENAISGESTPLHAAVRYRDEMLAMLIINKGANINALDEDGKTPLFYAIEDGDLKLVELLLNHGAISSKRLLFNAMWTGKGKLVECLLDHGLDINDSETFGPTALHAAPTVDQWYHQRQDGKPFGELMIFGNDSQKNKSNVPERRGHITRLLLERGAQVNAKTADGTTALHIAAGEGCRSAIEALLEFHADIYARNAEGDTPLDIAVRSCGNPEAVEILLKLEGGANAKDKNGKFYFHVAAKKNSRDVVEMFLKCGASVNCQDDAKKTALHYAAEEGNRETVKILLDSGAYINCRDELDETPLHKASYQRHFATVATLLTSGADVNALCSSNETALDKAKKSSSNLDAGLVLKNYIVLRTAANLFVRPQDLLTVGDYGKLDGFWSDYKTEVEKLMTEKIDNVSYYDLLTSNSSKLAKYVKNEAINQAFESGKFIRKFPLYANILKCQFRRGKERAALLRYDHKTSGILSDIFPELPSLCTDVIINYLSNDDLKILIGLEKLDLILQD